MPVVTIRLETVEYEVLQKLAYRERRNLKAQAAIAIRRELERAGLLPADGGVPDPGGRPAEVESGHAAQPA